MKGGGKWGERGREVGVGYPPVHPLLYSYTIMLIGLSDSIKVVSAFLSADTTSRQILQSI